MNTKIGWIIVSIVGIVIVIAAIFILRTPSANDIPERLAPEAVTKD